MEPDLTACMTTTHMLNVAIPYNAVAGIWVLSLAIPFYGTINSLFDALTRGLQGFVLPCLAFSWDYRTKERRANCPKVIPW